LAIVVLLCLSCFISIDQWAALGKGGAGVRGGPWLAKGWRRGPRRSRARTSGGEGMARGPGFLRRGTMAGGHGVQAWGGAL